MKSTQSLTLETIPQPWVEWNSSTDTFPLTISKSSLSDILTKQILISNVVKVFDILGWFAPAMVTAKILLQQVWKLPFEWDDPVPDEVQSVWR